jgi:hypothetical protein
LIQARALRKNFTPFEAISSRVGSIRRQFAAHLAIRGIALPRPLGSPVSPPACPDPASLAPFPCALDQNTTKLLALAGQAARKKLDLIDFFCDNEGKPSLGSFQGRRFVVDDRLPTRAGTTDGTVWVLVAV